MTKTTTFLKLLCSMKNSQPTPRHPPTSLNRQKGPTCHPLHAEGSRQGSSSAPNVTNASRITPSSWNTSGSTVGCSPITALSVGGLSGQPHFWLVTGYGSVKMQHICASSVATVFPPPWTNSGTTAQNVAATTTVDSVGRFSRSPAV